MKANTPLRGGQDSPLSRLKLLEPSERAEIFDWRHTESPTPTNTEIRQRIAERFGIKLSRDGQLSLFWPWQRRQAQMDYYNETIAQDEAALAKKYPVLEPAPYQIQDILDWMRIKNRIQVVCDNSWELIYRISPYQLQFKFA